MTKEEILINKSEGLPVPLLTDLGTLYPPLAECMDEYAKQEAVEFFKFNAKNIAEYMKYLRTADLALGKSTYEEEMNFYELTTLENRYDIYLESKNKKP